MPKLRKTPEQLADIDFRTEIDRQAERFGYDRAELIKLCGIPDATFYKRRQDPGKTSLSELRRIVKALDMDARQICAILAVPYKAGTQ